jgi:LPXTG-motif cell wall-anchored protein
VDSDGTVVKTQTQTGKAGDQITVQIPDGYHVAGGNVPSLTIDPNHSVQTVNVIKDEHDTDNPTPSDKSVLNIIRYVDEDGNVVKTDHATGKAGDPITVKIPDGYHTVDGNVPTLKIDPKNPVHTISLIKDQHTDNPTHIDNDVLNIIKYVDEDGNVVKTDHAAGKAGDPIEVAIPAGYHTVDGNVPTLTIDPQNPIHIINIIKDKHETDNPTPSDKDVNTTIKYVDGNGNVIKTEHVTGKAGDAIKLHLPDGYHFKDGQAQTIFITKDGVQIVNIIKVDAALSPDMPNSAASKAANRKLAAAASQKQARNGKQSENQLPQTGNKSLAIAGLALLGLASLMGLSGFKKRRD